MPADTSEQPDLNPGVKRIRDLVMGIASSLVDAPGALSVRHETSGDLTRLVLSVPADDLDKVLGEKGRTARSLRTLVTAVASRLPTRIALDIVEGV